MTHHTYLGRYRPKLLADVDRGQVFGVEDGRVRHGRHGLGIAAKVDVGASPDSPETGAVRRTVGAPEAPGAARRWVGLVQRKNGKQKNVSLFLADWLIDC